MESAVRLLRNRGVRGSDTTLRQLAEEFGTHALTLDHLAQVLVGFLAGDPRRVREISPAEIVGTDAYSEKQGQRLARIFRFYERNLPRAELEILRLISCFRFPVGLRTLEDLLTTKEVRRRLADAGRNQKQALYRLRERKLVYAEPNESGERFVTHPAIREYFYHQISHPEAIHRDVAVVLSGSVPRSTTTQNDDSLNLLEELVYHAVQSGDYKNGFAIFLNKMGGYNELGHGLGAYQRGYTILKLFVPAGQTVPGTPPGLTEDQLKEYYLQQSLFAGDLGDLALAVSALKAHIRRSPSIDEEARLSDAHIQLFDYHILGGSLDAARNLIRDQEQAISNEFNRRKEELRDEIRGSPNPDLENTQARWHRLAELQTEADKRVDACKKVIDGLMASQPISDKDIEVIQPGDEWWSFHGNLSFVTMCLRHMPGVVADVLIRKAPDLCGQPWNKHSARWRIELAYAYTIQRRFTEAREILSACLDWSMRTANQEVCASTQLAFARLHVLEGDLGSATRACDSGWLIAEECEFRLHKIDLLNVKSELCLLNKQSESALVTTRDALRLVHLG